MLLCSFSLSVCSFFPSFPQVCLSLHPSIFPLACLSLLLSKPASLCSPYLHFLYSLTPFPSFPPICVLLSLSHYFLSYTPSTFSFPLINHCLSIHFLKLSAQSVSLPSCPTFSPNPFLRLFPLSFHILFLFYTTPSSSPSLLYTLYPLFHPLSALVFTFLTPPSPSFSSYLSPLIHSPAFPRLILLTRFFNFFSLTFFFFPFLSPSLPIWPSPLSYPLSLHVFHLSISHCLLSTFHLFQHPSLFVTERERWYHARITAIQF